MNILILGAGQVGSSAAYDLSRSAANEVTVVDIDDDRLREMRDRLDIRTVHGHASHPHVLEQAGCADADIVIALTDSDETNMLACQIAYTLYRTPTKIARIRALEYTNVRGLFAPDSVPVDDVIAPEQLVTEHIEQLIHYPGALQVLSFADGKVRLAGVVARRGPSSASKVVVVTTLFPRGPGALNVTSTGTISSATASSTAASSTAALSGF
jgi:trk system potassium uptake protein TrkA